MLNHTSCCSALDTEAELTRSVVFKTKMILARMTDTLLKDNCNRVKAKSKVFRRKPAMDVPSLSNFFTEHKMAA